MSGGIEKTRMDIEQLRQSQALYRENYRGSASAEFEEACRRIYWETKEAESKNGVWIGRKIPSKAEYRRAAFRWSRPILSCLLLLSPADKDVMIGAGAIIYGARIFEIVDRQKRDQEEKAMRARREHWLALNWDELEWETVKLFEGLGYEASTTKGSGDKGVDVVATRKDRKIIVQCKQHGKPVGSPDVSRLAVAMLYHQADEGILVAPRGFSAHAIDFAANCGVDLWDAHDLSSKVPRDEDEPPITVPVPLLRPPPLSAGDKNNFYDARLSVLGIYTFVILAIMWGSYDAQRKEIHRTIQRAKQEEWSKCRAAQPDIPNEHPILAMRRKSKACGPKP